jgi:hypothetical protein
MPNILTRKHVSSSHYSSYPRTSEPLPPANVMKKFWSSNSLLPAKTNFLEKTIWNIRTVLIGSDTSMLILGLSLTYLFLLFLGVFLGAFGTALFFIWLAFITLVPVVVVSMATIWIGSKVLYPRTYEATVALRELTSSTKIDCLSESTLTNYMKEIMLLDSRLAEVVESRIEIGKALDMLPDFSNFDSLVALSLSVEAAEHDLDINNISELKEELHKENDNLGEIQKEILQKIDLQVKRALEGYDPVVVAEQKKTAQAIMMKAKAVRENFI